MTDYLNKSFSVYPGGSGSQEYRDNWDRIFGKKEAAEMPSQEDRYPRCVVCGVLVKAPSERCLKGGYCKPGAAPGSSKEKGPGTAKGPEPEECKCWSVSGDNPDCPHHPC